VALGIPSSLAWGQAPQEQSSLTPSSGNVAGKVTDDAGLPIRNALVSIRSRATQTSISARTDSKGEYTSEQVPSGTYAVRVESPNYQTVDVSVNIPGGGTARADARLLPINPGTPSAKSTSHASEFDSLPINGRNFLDITQTLPAVQVVDGAALGAAKTGLFDLSINDRAGRTTHLQLDGTDIIDETHGSTTQNLAASGISEIAVTRALQDLSTPRSGAGTVDVITRSGSNDVHGSGFFDYRNKGAGFANFPGGKSFPFDRSQFGGSVGGALRKDRAFFFIGAEHVRQNGDNPVALTFPFNLLSGGYKAPYRDTNVVGRLDGRLRPYMKLFYRGSYDTANDVWSISNFSPYRTENIGQNHTVGLDFAHGVYSHSVRFAYLRYSNSLTQQTEVGSIFNPLPGMNVSVGQLQTGPSTAAPTKTLQSNEQIRYDGIRPWRNHSFRFGGAFNRISTGGFYAQGAGGATISGSPTLANVQALLGSATAPFGVLIAGDPAGPADNPLNYALTGITLYSGRQFTSEQSAFGYPGGGFFDNRIDAYLGDAWKVFPNLTISGGVHYVRDTGRTDSDVAPVTCAQVNRALFPNPPCFGNTLLLDQFGNIPGLGVRVQQPNTDISPQVGLAWDPGRNGKTVVRLGAGLYYDDNLFNNVLFDRRVRLAQGQFAGRANLCPSGSLLFPNGSVVSSVDGLDIASQICGQPIGNVAHAVSDLQAAYLLAGRSGTFNPYFVGNTLSTMSSVLAPKYKSPQVVQINAGIERKIGRNGAFSLDYVREIGTHFLLGSDTNLVGSAVNINVNAALAAINATLASNPLSSGVCAPATSAGSSSLTAVNCYLSHVANANITDFARHGLDSGNTYCGGYACSLFGKSAAFAGKNPAVGSNVMYFPIGRSSYNAIQIGLRNGVDNPFRRVRRMDLLFSYTWSRYKDNVPIGSDGQLAGQDVLSPAQDFLSSTRFFGPSSLDRTHQVTIAPVFELPRGLLLSFITHLASPLPTTLYLPQAGAGGTPGEIFRSDVTGDGTSGDVAPGSHAGDYGRGISDLAKFIRNYDNVFASQLTPAGGQLVTSNLFDTAQLVALGATTPIIQTPPANAVRPTWLKTLDLRLAFPIHIGDDILIEPRVSAYNVLNLANYNSPLLPLSGVLDSSPGRSVNNTTSNCGIVVGICTAQANRIGPGSGVYSQAAPRQLEFGLRVSF